MRPSDFVVFGATLFLALVVLMNWKRRRDQNARRVSRGLRGYVLAKPSAPPATGHKADENLLGQGILT